VVVVVVVFVMPNHSPHLQLRADIWRRHFLFILPDTEQLWWHDTTTTTASSSSSSGITPQFIICWRRHTMVSAAVCMRRQMVFNLKKAGKTNEEMAVQIIKRTAATFVTRLLSSTPATAAICDDVPKP
jgi:hypothetical protein